MTEEYAKNKVRLLTLLYGIYGGEKDQPPGVLPFSISEEGIVVLSCDLEAQMCEDKNKDLAVWTRENIANLL